ncbi:hypothetical protein [Nocardia ninae]|uniref:DUF1963 domain-containing protein n=2 Tax=Nocardia ninae TaxID=356145 RepID=A0A511MFB5_9NOCA|nr:hypothetical protein [Nocardia ninae]GEM38817.1 hypothetical protein NN4_33360 [Nocardia ninae NBRC 108245]
MHADPLNRKILFPRQATPNGEPLIPVLQLYADDIPDLPFPTETDVLQVLWCPHDHLPRYAPRPQLHWRDSSRCDQHQYRPPHPHGAQPEYLPTPCILHPERVIDYPGADLPRELYVVLEDRFDQLEQATGWLFDSDLAVSPGVKVSGYPTWTQSPDWPDCPTCKEPMNHLLTINSMEFNGDDWRIWLPREDQPATDPTVIHRDLAHLISPHGLTLGDGGGIYIFDCRTCPYYPYTYRYDCS